MSAVLDLEEELRGAVAALSTNQVPYALCGGLALAVHGYPRATKDIDLLVPPQAIEAALTALAGAGYTLRAGPLPLGFGSPHPQRLFRATKVLGNAHLTIDLLEVSASYQPAWASRQTLGWKAQAIAVVSREGLISMKSLSSRLKDRADLETLGAADEP